MDLRHTIERARLAPSAFYADRLTRAGSFEQLAPTTRPELLHDQMEHPPHGTRRFRDALPPVRAGVSGSGAELLVLTFTAADLARERAAGVRLLRAMGVEPGWRIANALPGALATPGSLLFGDVVEELGALDVPLGFPDTPAAATQAWKLIDRVEPQVLVVDARGAESLFTAVTASVRPWLKGIVLQSELATVSRDLELPSAAGIDAWQRHWLSVAEASSFVAASCAWRRYHPDQALCLEVASSAEVLPIGAGKLLLTPVGGDTPVLRYHTGVAAQLLASDCDCGAALEVRL